MRVPRRFSKGWECGVLILFLASPALAQVEDQLSAYTGKNATSYLQPLADAFGANLNNGLFHSGHVPTTGPHFSLEVRVMSVHFGDDDKTFSATTEGGFAPQTTVEASTVVGPGDATTVTANNGTVFSFPGGFDLSSFALAVPQLRIGSIAGTQALVRYFAMDTGDAELGDIGLFGFGLRHNLSQYFGPAFPVSLAGGFFWQSFTLGENDSGDDLIASDAFSIAVHASKGLANIEPYAGLSIDTFKMDVQYDADPGSAERRIELEFESDTTLHLTLGLALKIPFVNVHGEYNIAGQNSFSLGLAVGN